MVVVVDVIVKNDDHNGSGDQVCRGGGSGLLAPLLKSSEFLEGSALLYRTYVRLDKLLTMHFLKEGGQIGSYQ